MLSFSELSGTAVGVFCTWLLVVDVLSAWNLLQSLGQKRKSYVILSAAGVLFSFLMTQVTLDFCPETAEEFRNGICRRLGELGAFYWILTAAFMTIFSIALAYSYAKWGRSHVTVTSVKDGMEMLQAGLCYWKDNGQIILSNQKMNELCLEMTGESLLSGSLFYEAVRKMAQGDYVTMRDGSIRQFRYGQVLFYGEKVYELVATDVTEFYGKNEKLKKETESLRRMNENLRRYHQDIEEMVKSQEILQAKIRIHDEMNQLMLITTACMDANGSSAEMDKALTAWQDQVMLQGKMAEKEETDGGTNRVMQLAEVLGIRIIFSGVPVREVSEGNREILMVTAGEAIANAVKHADAKNLEIRVTVTDAEEEFLISNDGRLPKAGITEGSGLTNAGNTGGDSFTKAGITEGGGLTNVRRRVEMAGGRMEILIGDRFGLKIILPKN